MPPASVGEQAIALPPLARPTTDRTGAQRARAPRPPPAPDSITCPMWLTSNSPRRWRGVQMLLHDARRDTAPASRSPRRAPCLPPSSHVQLVQRRLFQLRPCCPLSRSPHPAPRQRPDRRHDAPSVLSPEIVIPSADAGGASLQSFCPRTVLLPESLPGRLLLRHRAGPDSPDMRTGLQARVSRAGRQGLASAATTAAHAAGMDPYFFGYGSLVNRLTHDHRAEPAARRGWRRAWRRTSLRRWPS